jgi:small redox-active disulfide protein 2
MEIKVLGAGCVKCKELAEVAMLAVEQLGLDCELEKVTDISEIIKFGVIMTPALVVDGKVVVAGKVPRIETLKEILTTKRAE